MSMEIRLPPMTLEQAILLKDALMFFLQSSPEESRPDIQKELDVVTEHIRMAVR